MADDMGIGKTIQTLVFLQSLRELKHSGAADLVVMPKSILTNWEREAARFTPNLKVFIHSGLDRPTSSEVFDNYDLILTTYGIMRRDIKLLREYRFHYLVLDESQAIKNPLADTSKAAKLLKTDHRLVLTGTPVENSTVELWSQFDFLNPGQLGTMEYFRSELAGPIERDQDPAAAEYLRSIVYPFILRRTKDQVAKELPPRTERVVYCDMSADQKKVYAEYRNSFRDQLLGKIEEEGINNVRMKILEGLLRLRQISNHPKLVNPAYTGDSAKFDVLLSTLETLQAEGHKVLVFSQFTKMLRIVRESLKKHKIKFLYLDGQTENRQEIVDEFQTDESITILSYQFKSGWRWAKPDCCRLCYTYRPLVEPGRLRDKLQTVHTVSGRISLCLFINSSHGILWKKRFLSFRKRKKLLWIN